jgi:signal transduction histidine kinase
MDGIQGQVLKTGESSRIDNIALDSHYRTVQQLNPSVQSLLVVPIVRGRDVLGVITLESNRLNGFSDEDNHFVSQIANQAVIAIDNARLFDSIMEARDRLQVILNAMEEGIVLIDERDTVALVNPRIDLIGIWQSELLSRTLRELASDAEINFIERAGFASLDEALGLMDGLRQHKIYPPVNYVVQGEHGVLHIRRQIIPLKSKDGQIIGALLIFYNKTEEEELAKAREELSRMIIHDLRSPLTAVTTSLKLMNDIVPKDAKYYPLVQMTTDTSRRAIRKLLGRVDSLLDIAKMESGQLSIEREVTELLPLVTNVIQELKPLAQELDIQIDPQIDMAMPPLDIDGDKVERLMLNLVDNALKYSPQGSKIIIRSHLPEQDGALSGYIRVDVVDFGPGVPSEYKATLFDRFVQIEGRRKVRRGVGLGLTFCRMVVEAHQGRIWIEDNPEGGSVFSFTLPFIRTGVGIADMD